MAYTLLRIFDEVDAQLSSEPRCTLRDQEAEFLLAGKEGKDTQLHLCLFCKHRLFQGHCTLCMLYHESKHL